MYVFILWGANTTIMNYLSTYNIKEMKKEERKKEKKKT